MKRALTLAIGLLSLATLPALAADLPARYPTKAPAMVTPVWNWTGFYIGVNGGYGWARSEHVDALGVTSGTFRQQGGLIGGTIGYNWQSGPAVFGLEADLDWARIDGSTPCGLGNNCFTQMRSFGTVRGRLGYAAGTWMPYITGGLAVADIRAGQDLFPAATTDQWRAGWTIGGGLEVLFAPGWSAKVEYLYADFGRSAVGYNAPLAVSVSERNVNVIRGGINYHFDWGGPVVARY
jgi:outer membrane immunogenic protein